MNKLTKLFLSQVLFLFIIVNVTASAQSTTAWFNADTVKAGKFDNGTMWTFEYAPKDYFEETYGFKPSDEWLEDVRLSALRFATYCSASFISEDGLVMTNNHCGREPITQVTKEGENLQGEGFFAATLEDERQVPGLFVDQLVVIKDVTEEVQTALEKGVNEEERTKLQKQIIKEIEERESKATSLVCKITPLYNGGKFSLYCYKRYNDVRLVFNPETQLGFFGGDPDNFTYPRYNMDCTFFRVYENGKPLKTKNYFKWSANGPKMGEPIFVVGNPGSTNRLNTIAQLEFQRDISYPRTLALLGDLIAIYAEKIKNTKDPLAKEELENQYLGFTNSYKAYEGILKGLRDPYLMAKKKDFEKNFKNAVNEKPALKEKFGELWTKIENSRKEIGQVSNEYFIVNINPFTSAQYFFIAKDLVDLANALKTPEADRDDAYKGEELKNTIAAIFPEGFDEELQKALLEKQINRMVNLLGKNNPLVVKMFGGKTDKEAFEYVLDNSAILSKDDVMELAEDGPDAILNSNDPFIYFILNTTARKDELKKKVDALSAKETAYNQTLGRALFEVYGTKIPPDATFTLRITDGVMASFPYNGTIAPPVTTFYGLYDRYYSFGKEFPFSLPKRWQTPPPEFNLETPFNFITTNDIIGGNSGSPVINKDAEIVGLAFDGNIQGLPGNFIFTTDENRCVNVHSAGMLEAIQDMYKATRLAEELKNGKLTTK